MLILASTATYAKGFELSSPDIQKGKVIPKTLFFITAFSYILSVAAFTKIIGGKYLLSWWAFGMPLIAAAIAFTAFSRVHTSLFSIMLSNISAFLGLATVLWLSMLSIRTVRTHITFQTPES